MVDADPGTGTPAGTGLPPHLRKATMQSIRSRVRFPPQLTSPHHKDSS